MKKITIARPDGRSTVIVKDDISPKEILDQEGITIGPATVMLDGMALSAEALRTPLNELGIDDETATIALCAKLQNA